MTRAGQLVPEGKEGKETEFRRNMVGGVGTGTGVAGHEEPTREVQQGIATEVPRPVSDPGEVAD